MTDTNTAASTAANTEARQEWPRRFGTMIKLVVKTTQGGKSYGVATLDCKAFTMTALVFNQKALENLKAAGENSRVWMKGPIEDVPQKNAEGGTYTKEVFKAVYAGKIEAKADKNAEGDAASEAQGDMGEQTAAPAGGGNMDEEIPF